MRIQFIGAMTRALGMREKRAIYSEGRDPKELFMLYSPCLSLLPFPFFYKSLSLFSPCFTPFDGGKGHESSYLFRLRHCLGGQSDYHVGIFSLSSWRMKSLRYYLAFGLLAMGLRRLSGILIEFWAVELGASVME